MEEFLPATGRVLRYWYGSMACRARQQLYDYLGVRPIENPKADAARAAVSWADSEVWSKPEPGHERTATIEPADIPAGIPRLNKRVRIAPMKSCKPNQRRPGKVLSSTFESTRSRYRRAGTNRGMSLI